MFCNYLDIYYRSDTQVLQSAVDHSKKNYQCKKMSACPYTGTSIIHKIPWSGQAGAKQDEDQDDDDSQFQFRASTGVVTQSGSGERSILSSRRLNTI